MKTRLIALLVSAALCYAAADDLVPAPKLRPSDPAKFFPLVVKLADDEIAEVESILRNELKREDLALQVAKSKALRAVPTETDVLVRFLDVSSLRVKEWALRALGEHPGDKRAAKTRLLKIVADKNAGDMTRALAARVIATSPMDPATVSLLADQIDGAAKEFAALLLEIIATSGQAGVPIMPKIKTYLTAREGIVQFYAYQALQHLEGRATRVPDFASQDNGTRVARPSSSASSVEPSHYVKARDLDRLQEQRFPPSEIHDASLSALKDTQAPAYLIGVALQKLTSAGENPQAIRAIINAVGHKDAFVSELAANVLNALNGLSSEGIAVLAEKLSDSNARVRLACAQTLRRLGPVAADVRRLTSESGLGIDQSLLTSAATAASALAATLSRATNGGATPREIGVCLDALRGLGTNAAPAAPAILALLPEQSPLYRNVAKHNVDRLRGFLLVTLAQVGVPNDALSFIVNGLANSDDRMSYEFAGAARAAGAMGRAAKSAVPFLLRPLEKTTPQDFLNFEQFDAHTSSTGQYTTCQIEALRALRQMGVAAASAAPTVAAFLERAPAPINNPSLIRQTPDVRAEAQLTLAALENAAKPKTEGAANE